MSSLLRFFDKAHRKHQLLGIFILYSAYPELKRQYYDNFLIDKEDKFNNNSINRRHIKLTNQQQKNIEEEFEDCGFDYHEATGFDWSFLNFWTPQYYWENRAAYEFQPRQVDELMKATFEIQNMCLEAVDLVINNPGLLTTAFDIPTELHDTIINSWKNNEQDLLCRLDFLYNKQQGFKFIEANADTPTVLLEAGLASEIWAEQTNKKQFNVISQTISNAWKEIMQNSGCKKLVGLSYGVVKDSTKTETEDKCNVRYLINLADSVFNADDIHLQDIRFIDDYLLDKNLNTKTCLWKLYPYEWMVEESAGIHFDKNHQQNKNIKLMEPAWKLIMANKAILPILWSLYPNNKYLLPSYFTINHDKNIGSISMQDAVAKRVFGREGKNVTIGNEYSDKKSFITDALNKGDNEIDHTLGKVVFQQYYKNKKFTGRSVTVGSWLVHGLPAGLGVREDIREITNNNSSFVPHYVAENKNDNNNFSDEFQTDQNDHFKESFQENFSFDQQNNSQNVYEPQEEVIFQMSQKQSDLRKRFYGNNKNNYQKIYEGTPLQEKTKVNINNETQLSQNQINNAIHSINDQLNQFTTLRQTLKANTSSSRSISSGNYAGRRRSGYSDYLAAKYMANQESQRVSSEGRQSSASKSGVSHSERASSAQRTGTIGRGFSSSS